MVVLELKSGGTQMKFACSTESDEKATTMVLSDHPSRSCYACVGSTVAQVSDYLPTVETKGLDCLDRQAQLFVRIGRSLLKSYLPLQRGTSRDYGSEEEFLRFAMIELSPLSGVKRGPCPGVVCPSP